jgi:glycosyltransferase involved in cell wall biosynthesis
MGRWAREVEQHDVAFFAWPYGIDVPKLSLPMAFIPHDLNYTHFVGAFVDSPSSWHHTRALHAEWLRRAHPVVSSQGIADELRNEFPLSQTPTEVIPISHLSSRGKLDDATAREIVQGLGVQNKYVLCLNNVSAHKNLGQVLSGFHYVQKKHPDLQLVLSGPGTSPLNGECRSPFYLDLDVQADSILGLGNRTDLEVKALIQCAIAVVNGSLYEAGNGSGLDAWALGTPVVMSAIPSFLEHLRVLDVRAETFHPRCCFEIADALLRVLDNPARAQHNAKISQIAMQHYPWSRVGERYAEFFERIARIHTEHDFVQAKAA